MLALVECRFGRHGSDPTQVQSSRPTWAFACHDPQHPPTNRWIRAERVRQPGEPAGRHPLPRISVLPRRVVQDWSASAWRGDVCASAWARIRAHHGPSLRSHTQILCLIPHKTEHWPDQHRTLRPGGVSRARPAGQHDHRTASPRRWVDSRLTQWLVFRPPDHLLSVIGRQLR